MGLQSIKAGQHDAAGHAQDVDDGLAWHESQIQEQPALEDMACSDAARRQAQK